MAITQLFVELLVIGFGALPWLVLVVTPLLGEDASMLAPKLLTSTALLPVLSVVYVLGIVVDRVADWIFDRWDRRYRDEVFNGDLDAYFNARRVMVVHGPELWAHLEYGRSRLRICRGWALNIALFLFVFDVFTLARWSAEQGSVSRLVFLNLLLGAFGILCVVCWRALNRSEYKKIRRQSTWIENMTQSKGEPNDRPEGGKKREKE